MPATPEEMLNQLVAATDEAKVTIRELHEARKLYIEVEKKERERITTAIVEEVQRQAGQLSKQASAEMRERMTLVMAGIEADWRAKLGL